MDNAVQFWLPIDKAEVLQLEKVQVEGVDAGPMRKNEGD